ncbi:phosphotransferase family protein [Halomonas sp. V046]|uniref:phosphotransferase family protein n=1 Tax=Halomonas sp. V046 TaxID=3459611 RepID=UPI004044BE51
MILTRHNALMFLVSQGLLSLEDLVRHPLAVRQHSQRNRGFSVTWPNGQGYFIKQHRPDAGPWEPRSSVVNEADVLTRLSQDASCRRRVPALRLFDRHRQALVIDWQDATEACASVVALDDPDEPAAAALLGRELAALHRDLAPLDDADGSGQRFSRQPPWVLRFDRLHPLAGDDQSWAQAKLVAMIGQHRDILDALAALARDWPHQQLIHGDMKWQNCLIRRVRLADADCVFIDWEMAGLGDPLWDLAGLAQSWLKAWSDALPQAPGAGAEALSRSAAARLAPAQAALRSLWQAYTAAHPRIDRTRFIALCGARLIQTLYEESADDADPPPSQLVLLQLAQNLLHHPDQGGALLLGAR